MSLFCGIELKQVAGKVRLDTDITSVKFAQGASHKTWPNIIMLDSPCTLSLSVIEDKGVKFLLSSDLVGTAPCGSINWTILVNVET